MLTSKAIVSMSGPRRHRKDLLKSVNNISIDFYIIFNNLQLNARKGSLKISLKSSMAASKFKNNIAAAGKNIMQNEKIEVGNPFLYQGIGENHKILKEFIHSNIKVNSKME